jgi:hypothetical protein
MNTKNFGLEWRDVIRAIFMTLIGNFIMLVMALPEDQLPTWLMIKSNLIVSIKGGVLPYLLMRYFTDDVKRAQKVMEKVATKSTDSSANITPLILLLGLFLPGCSPSFGGGGWIIPVGCLIAAALFFRKSYKTKMSSYFLFGMFFIIATIVCIIWMNSAK